MGKARLFSTAPVSAMQDADLTGLDWRLLLWVSLHDGMSIVKGKGSGCYASNRTLFAEARCEYAAGCRSLSRLVERGHLIREKTGRATVYRVAFHAPDMLPTGNLSGAGYVAETQSKPPEYVAELFGQNPENETETDRHYIPLKGKLDSVETEELNSFEKAHLSDARYSEEAVEGTFTAASLGVNLSADKKLDAPEGGLGREWRLAAKLPTNWRALPIGAQVARVDRAYTDLGRTPSALHDTEREAFTEWLGEVFDEFMGGDFDATAQQALRLREEMFVW